MTDALAQTRGVPPLDPEEVHQVAFRKPRLGSRGYDEDEVDAFLDLVEAELRWRASPEGQADDGRPGPVATAGTRRRPGWWACPAAPARAAPAGPAVRAVTVALLADRAGCWSPSWPTRRPGVPRPAAGRRDRFGERGHEAVRRTMREEFGIQLTEVRPMATLEEHRPLRRAGGTRASAGLRGGVRGPAGVVAAAAAQPGAGRSPRSGRRWTCSSQRGATAAGRAAAAARLSRRPQGISGTRRRKMIAVPITPTMIAMMPSVCSRGSGTPAGPVDVAAVPAAADLHREVDRDRAEQEREQHPDDRQRPVRRRFLHARRRHAVRAAVAGAGSRVRRSRDRRRTAGRAGRSAGRRRRAGRAASARFRPPAARPYGRGTGRRTARTGPGASTGWSAAAGAPSSSVSVLGPSPRGSSVPPGPRRPRSAPRVRRWTRSEPRPVRSGLRENFGNGSTRRAICAASTHRCGPGMAASPGCGC